jgi:hypothetical protein
MGAGGSHAAIGGDEVSTSTTTERAVRAQEQRKRDQALVALHKAGDGRAFGRLYDLWFDAVFDRIVHRGVLPRDAAGVETAAFSAAADDLAEATSPETFAVIALRAARRATARAGGGAASAGPRGTGAERRLAAATDAEAIALDAEVAALCWQSADVLGERVRESLDLHYRHGLSSREIAAVLRERPEAIAALLPKLGLGFGNAVRARMVWRGGAPEHDELRQELVGHDRFDPDTVRIVSRHLKECDRCREPAVVALSPVEVFAAIPVASAPVGLKEQVASKLASGGVAMNGSTHLRPADRAAPADPTTSATPDGSSPESPPHPDHPARGVGSVALVGAGGLGATVATSPAVAHQTPPTGDPVPPPPAPSEAADTSDPTPAPTNGASSGADPAAAPVDESTFPAGHAASPAPPPPPGPTPSTAPGPAHEPVRPGERKAGADVIGAGRRRWLIGGAVAAALLIVAGIVALTSGGDDRGGVETAAVRQTTTTTAAPTSTTRAPVTTSTAPLPTTTVPVTAPAPSPPAPDPEPGVAVAPASPGVPPAPAPAPPEPVTSTTLGPLDLSISFGLQPSQIEVGGSARLTWDISATRALAVTITGPNGFYAETLAGNVAVCPTSGCTGVPGQYPYSLRVLEGGRLVGERTILLTIRA